MAGKVDYHQLRKILLIDGDAKALRIKQVFGRAGICAQKGFDENILRKILVGYGLIEPNLYTYIDSDIYLRTSAQVHLLWTHELVMEHHYRMIVFEWTSAKVCLSNIF